MVTVEKNVSMQKKTTFGIGGPAGLFYLPKNSEEFCSVVAEHPGAFILGGGSNLLVSDGGIDVVISLKRFKGFYLSQKPDGTAHVTAGAGIGFTALANKAWRAGLSGLEFAYGIPGTVGGAVVMNAGAHGMDVKEKLESVDIILNGETKTLRAQELGLSYRSSSLPEGAVISSATFSLTQSEPSLILERMRRSQKTREETQPLDLPSAGSVFKNPPGRFAGKVIDELGLKGTRIGDAQVSPVHANFIVNLGKATAAHLLELIEKVETAVTEKTGIRLEREIKLVGNF